MSLACPLDLDSARLRVEIQSIYTRVADAPDGPFHFHRGPEYAATVLGYDRSVLALVPSQVAASFAGIGNPHAIRPLPQGAVVVDIGCGAGTDLLIAARRVGPAGRAIGVDMTDEMLQRARAGAEASGLGNVELRRGDATSLPVADRSVDVVISNGVLNLVPEKSTALGEIWRVLRPGGRVQIADITVGAALPEPVRRDADLWAG
jgi:SAM-dependent methyltransferase